MINFILQDSFLKKTWIWTGSLSLISI